MSEKIFKNTKPPEWIVKLPAGEYYIQDLVKITGYTGFAIAFTLKKYGVTIKKEPCYRNLVRNKFIWKGYDPLYKKKEFKKKQKLETEKGVSK